MLTLAVAVVLAAFTFVPAEGQQCSELFCPGLGQCLNQSTVCNSVNECENGSGFILDENRCTGKTFMLFALVSSGCNILCARHIIKYYAVSPAAFQRIHEDLYLCMTRLS